MNPTIPEYIRMADVPKHFSISRSTAYNLIADGLIESICMKRPGNVKGVRLIKTESLRQYFASCSQAPGSDKGRRELVENLKSGQSPRRHPNKMCEMLQMIREGTA